MFHVLCARFPSAQGVPHSPGADPSATQQCFSPHYFAQGTPQLAISGHWVRISHLYLMSQEHRVGFVARLSCQGLLELGRYCVRYFLYAPYKLVRELAEQPQHLGGSAQHQSPSHLGVVIVIITQVNPRPSLANPEGFTPGSKATAAIKTQLRGGEALQPAWDCSVVPGPLLELRSLGAPGWSLTPPAPSQSQSGWILLLSTLCAGPGEQGVSGHPRLVHSWCLCCENTQSPGQR